MFCFVICRFLFLATCFMSIVGYLISQKTKEVTLSNTEELLPKMCRKQMYFHQVETFGCPEVKKNIFFKNYYCVGECQSAYRSGNHKCSFCKPVMKTLQVKLPCDGNMKIFDLQIVTECNCHKISCNSLNKK